MARKPDQEFIPATEVPGVVDAQPGADSSNPNTSEAKGSDAAERTGAESAAPVDLPVEFDEAVIRAWLETPAGQAFLLNEALPASKPPEPGERPQGQSLLEAAANYLGIAVADVLDWREYPDRVVLVTRDGQKLTLAKG